MKPPASDDKTLLPELLPGPAPLPAQSPQARVAERARQMLDRFRGLGLTAGAAVLGLQCRGYEVVDPLPPPPAQCSSTANPFDSLRATAHTAAIPAALPNIVLEISVGAYPAYAGFRLDAVRMEGGTVVHIADATTDYQGSRFVITAVPAYAETRMVQFELVVGCAGATTTLRYQLAYEPRPSIPLMVTAMTPAAGDAGARD